MPQLKSAGRMFFDKVTTADKLGIRTGSITQMVEMFVEWGNLPGDPTYAAYWIQMRNGVLLLEMTPGKPASGAIYLLDLTTQTFYEVSFEELGANLTRRQFDLLVKEYCLIQYASNPRLIHSKTAQAATA
jgi:hypothetical protein